MMQDLRYTFRQLIKRPGFTAVAVLTLALGVGANTAIFSVVDAVLLEPLPFPDPDRLVVLGEDHRARGGTRNELFSPPRFFELRERSRSLEGVAAMLGWDVTLTGGGSPERLAGLTVSPGYFELLGARPALGRLFMPEDATPAGARIVVLSHGLWQRHFGGASGVLGRSITLDGDAYTVIGVAPAGFRAPGTDAEIWKPMRSGPMRGAFRFHILRVIGRLAPGASLERARAELDAIAAAIAREYPETSTGKAFTISAMHERLVGPVRPALLLLLGAVGFVLLIACANIANLLLARAAAREKEIAVRAALGAGRGRIVRQLLTESVVLAFLGGGLGVLIALWGVDLLAALGPPEMPRLDRIAVDGPVLGFAFVISLLSGITFGLIPALPAARSNLGPLRGAGSGRGTERRPTRTRSGLMIAEIAIALLLLTGAGLLIRSFAGLLRVDPGFDAGHILTVDLSLPRAEYDEDAAIAVFYDELFQRLTAKPGILSVGAAAYLPLDGRDFNMLFRIRGRTPTGGGGRPRAWYRHVGGDYFRTMGIPILAGRAFTDRAPTAARGGHVIINRALARRYWPGEDPIGKRLSPEWAAGEWLTVIGVVGDVRHNGLDRTPVPELYLPARGGRSWTLVVRTASDPLRAAPAVREAVWSLDPELPVEEFATMERRLARSLARPWTYASLFSAFAALALLLAAVGIYGVTSDWVSRRTREIGIRMALGAREGDVLRRIIRRSLGLALIGIIIGFAGALALTRLLSGLLFDVSATDPLTFAGVAVLLGAVALLASYIPARRAAKVDPMDAMRAE